MIGSFHFIRPWWLAALVPVALFLWGLTRRGSVEAQWQHLVSPHLLPHLLIGHRTRRDRRPLMLLGLVWLLATLGVAGPTWRREPSPFVEDTAALVIVLKVTPSMKSQDIQPSRLERSIQKMHDLLQKRPGAKAALIVYSSTVHTVVPLTADAGLIDMFAGALDPAIMPGEGDACVDAIRTASELLKRAQVDGSILWITDGAAAGAPEHLKRLQKLPDIRLLLAASDESAKASVVAAADAVSGDVIELQADDSDVDRLARDTHFASAGGGSGEDRWRESGYVIVPVVLLAALPLFRRGVLGTIAESGGDA